MSTSTFPEIEQYSLNHSHHPSALAQELYDYTCKNVTMSQMLIGPMVASFLQTLIRMNKMTNILEVGTFTGYSALAMAEAMPKDGRVITLDVNEENVAVAKSFWEKSPVKEKIVSHLGDAKETIKKLKEEGKKFDLIFLDADKESNPHYLEMGLSMLSERGLVIIDNSLRDGKVLKESSSPSIESTKKLNEMVSKNLDLQSTLLPLRDGLLMVTKK